jgi:peptidyl-prolyl cis-trans isomerase A (cyclophilin A)
MTHVFRKTMSTSALRRAAVAVGFLALVGSVQAQGKPTPKVKFATTMGDIVVELYPDAAPKTVANMLQYVKDKHYDGTVFHRVIDNFMIQGGGLNSDMAEKKTREPVEHEGRASFAKGNKNVIGTIAMARTPEPNSATGQFFINVRDNGMLDPTDTNPGYTVFGKVTSGMDVVNKIKASPTGNKAGHQNVPITPITITSATLEK